MKRLSITLFTTLLIALCDAATAASPAVGGAYVYRVINGYNQEVRGEITFRVDKVDADHVTVTVTATTTALATPHTEIYTREGNWLRHPLTNDDQPVEYEFSPPYPAYVFPLETGKSWSLRVTATNSASAQRNSVRVDGEVLGTERITTPAGPFDTIKVMRRVYAGDWESFRRETNIVETDWYAPTLGRPVRAVSNSRYFDLSRCSRGPCDPFRGDWNIFELIEVRSAKP